MLALVALVVVIGLVGYLLVAGSSHASHTPQAAASHPAASHHPSPPAPTPSQSSTPPPSPTAAPPPPPATTLDPAGVTTFGPNGGDNSQLARHAIDGSSGSAWHTDWYTSADFGGLQHGTGLLLNMGKQVTITSARITLGRGAGTSLQLRAGDSPSLGGLKQVAHASNANGVVNLHIPSPAHGRYLLIWITKLPPDSSGTFQASVSRVRVSGRT